MITSAPSLSLTLLESSPLTDLKLQECKVVESSRWVPKLWSGRVPSSLTLQLWREDALQSRSYVSSTMIVNWKRFTLWMWLQRCRTKLSLNWTLIKNTLTSQGRQNCRWKALSWQWRWIQERSDCTRCHQSSIPCLESKPLKLLKLSLSHRRKTLRVQL